jgi:hypothetical protein
MNLIAALGAYCFLDKKPSIQFDMEEDKRKLFLLY